MNLDFGLRIIAERVEDVTDISCSVEDLIKRTWFEVVLDVNREPD